MLSLEEDDRLLMKEDSTLKAAGIGEKECGAVLEGHRLSWPAW